MFITILYKYKNGAPVCPIDQTELLTSATAPRPSPRTRGCGEGHLPPPPTPRDPFLDEPFGSPTSGKGSPVFLGARRPASQNWCSSQSPFLWTTLQSGLILGIALRPLFSAQFYELMALKKRNNI